MYTDSVQTHARTHTHKCTNTHTVQVSTLSLQCMVVKETLNIMASMHTYAHCANVHTLLLQYRRGGLEYVECTSTGRPD